MTPIFVTSAKKASLSALRASASTVTTRTILFVRHAHLTLIDRQFALNALQATVYSIVANVSIVQIQKTAPFATVMTSALNAKKGLC